MKVNMSLKKKILVLGLSVFIGLASIIIITLSSTSRLTSLFQDKDLTLGVKITMLQIRKSEKDFMARNDIKYADEAKARMAALRERLDSLIKSYPDNEALTKLQTYLADYEKEFTNVVELRKEIGLNEESGYYGALRSKVHNVEDFSKKLGLVSVTKDMLMLRRHEKDFMLRRNLKYKDSFEKDFAFLMKSINVNVPDATVRNNMIKLADLYRDDFMTLVQKETEFGLQPSDGAQGRMRNAAKLLEEDVNIAIDNFSTEIAHKQKTNKYTTAVVIFVVSTIIITILVALLYNIIGLINRLSATTQDLLKFGNLQNADKEHSKCEITTISILLEMFKQKVYNTMSVVKESSHSVASGNTELSAVTEQLSSTFISQSEQMTASAGAMEEMTASSQHVVSNIEQSAQINVRTLQSSEAGKNKLNILLDNINNIEQDTKKLSETIRGLSNSSAEIGNILVVINDIADQTNLLALNAAIEAARAGDAGRGFAVVADEVRKLAEKTQMAIKNISDIINTLVKETKFASEDMARASETVKHVFTAANDTGKSFTEISETIQELNNTNNNIEVAVKEQVEAIQNINGSFQILVSGIDESSMAVSEISHTVTDLQKQADDLNSLIKEFNI
jgi:methyl-accepting chemotaxis protein